MTKQEICDEAVKQYPDLPTTTLAKMLFKQHPAVFTKLDNVRAMIRYRRGNKGEYCRQKAKKNHGATFRENGQAGYKIPASDKKENRSYKLVKGRWLILSDIHIPYHDEEALEIALKFAEDNNVDHIYLNGDICDFYNISSYQKDSEERDLSNELTKTRQFLGHLRYRFPKSRIVYKLGNHEDRWERYLFHKAPELMGVSNFEMYYILNFAKYGIELVKSMQKAKAGKHLTILHGHEVRNSGVYPARTLLQRTHVCTIAGHNHRTSTYGEKDADGKIIGSWTSGCLCELSPDYMPINQWNLGFVMLDFDGKDFTVENKRIIKGLIK